MFEPPEALVGQLADLYTMGQYTQTKLGEQVTALTDPFSGIEIDPQIGGFAGLDTTQSGEQDVRDTVLRWLGPAFGGWSDGQVAEWAGRIRNDPDGELALRELLEGQRLSLYPEYENPNLTYEDIAGPWRGFMQQAWGEIPDETNPLFAELLHLNDYKEAGSLLRGEGIKQGIGKVVDDLRGEAVGTNQVVRRST